MIGLLNGFLGVTEFFESIADSFIETFDALSMPISNAFRAFSLFDDLTVFPDFIWVPFLGLLGYVLAMIVVKILNYLPLW